VERHLPLAEPDLHHLQLLLAVLLVRLLVLLVLVLVALLLVLLSVSYGCALRAYPLLPCWRCCCLFVGCLQPVVQADLWCQEKDQPWCCAWWSPSSFCLAVGKGY
jgi:hypothetical protein